MSFLNSVLKAFVGDKKKKDLKLLQPLVDKVRSFDKEMSQLSIDELRGKTTTFKMAISGARKPFEDQIEILNKEIETSGIDRKEAIYKEIDQLNDDAYEATENVLNEIQPEAFAVMRETAKRFSENSTLKVKATAFDRELSVHDYVTLEGDHAIWSNTWDAAGKPITWDMVHYDVQLIGGVALHSGRIAEMATGEGKTLVATLPVFLNALSGKGVHVVTVNDYLAKRDSEWMGPIYEFHGLTVDCIDKHKPNSEARRKA